MNICKQIFISGLVQGVFFRDSTRHKANELNLSGGVRNCHDGRVEVQVMGKSAAVFALIKWLEIGPKHAKVSTIEVIDLPVSCLHDNKPITKQNNKGHFEIWPTR